MKITAKEITKLEQEWFENYLIDVHYDLFPTVLDDELPDHFDDWVGGLKEEELLEYSRKCCLIPHKRIAQEFIGTLITD